MLCTPILVTRGILACVWSVVVTWPTVGLQWLDLNVFFFYQRLLKEEDFVKPSSMEEAQKMWEKERAKMLQVMNRQQQQMFEDNKWLKHEEQSLVNTLKVRL